jgi:hypothetical protein
MSKYLLIISFLSIFAVPSILGEDHQQKSMNVTVYNNDLGVIRDVREIEINKGISEIRIQGVAERIDPTSVHIKFNGNVLEQNYQYDLVSMDKILNKYIDKEIIISGDQLAVTGTLLSANRNQLVIREKDGGLTMLPNVEEYQINVGELPEGLITRPTLVWKIDSKQAGKQDVELSYQTKGMNWHAEYVAVLNENDTKMGLNSWVSIENNSGATYKDAKLKLVAGDVNMVQDRNVIYAKRDMYMASEVEAVPQFKEKEFFEYHIYKLQRPATISNNEIKQISLFEQDGVKIDKKYKFKPDNWNSNKKVAVTVEFKNSEDNNLGMPMPKGKVRLYKSDGESIEFIGEDMIDHTPRNEELSLKVGDAFDIIAKEITEKENKISNSIRDYTYLTTINNRKKEKIIVEVEKKLGLDWEITKTNIDYEKLDAHTVLFKVPVNADEEKELRYTVRYIN